jgi:hypothetical protein
VLTRRVRILVASTITYNVLEAVVALSAGAVASSTALIGFGLDSVEVTSTAVVGWRPQHVCHLVEGHSHAADRARVPVERSVSGSHRHGRRWLPTRWSGRFAGMSWTGTCPRDCDVVASQGPVSAGSCAGRTLFLLGWRVVVRLNCTLARPERMTAKGASCPCVKWPQ